MRAASVSCHVSAGSCGGGWLTVSGIQGVALGVFTVPLLNPAFVASRAKLGAASVCRLPGTGARGLGGGRVNGAPCRVSVFERGQAGLALAGRCGYNVNGAVRQQVNIVVVVTAAETTARKRGSTITMLDPFHFLIAMGNPARWPQEKPAVTEQRCPAY